MCMKKIFDLYWNNDHTWNIRYMANYVSLLVQIEIYVRSSSSSFCTSWQFVYFSNYIFALKYCHTVYVLVTHLQCTFIYMQISLSFHLCMGCIWFDFVLIFFFLVFGFWLFLVCSFFFFLLSVQKIVSLPSCMGTYHYCKM